MKGIPILRELRTTLRNAAPEMRIAVGTDAGRQHATALARAAH